MPFILLTVFIVISDQVLKLIVKSFLSPGESIPLIKNFFHITLVHNSGAAFGVFKNQTILFVVLSIVAIIFIIYSFPRLKDKAVLHKAALSLILGGAISNLIDRLYLGYVIDFLDFRVWPVFNIADSAITVGALLFIIKLLRKK